MRITCIYEISGKGWDHQTKPIAIPIGLSAAILCFSLVVIVKPTREMNVSCFGVDGKALDLRDGTRTIFLPF